MGRLVTIAGVDFNMLRQLFQQFMSQLTLCAAFRGCLPKRAKSSGFLWITHFAPAARF
jgi:hypothetical protein